VAVSLRILNETKVGIDETQRRLGADETPIHFTSVYRLMNRGVKAPDGQRVYLEHLRVGGKLITSLEAIERFVAATNGVDLDGAELIEALPASSKQRAKELAEIDRQLAAAGI
jgi:Protein of unknown function (DUF1580)